jgi:DNA-directed RNA polymerase specialized sigma24 family protein
MRFEDIQSEEWTKVEILLRRYFTGKVRDPEDRVQETLRRVIEALIRDATDLTGDSALARYCYAFAKYIRMEAKSDKSFVPLPISLPAPEHRTQGMNSVEVIALVREALKCLGADERRLLEDADLLSLDQLAHKYGIPKRRMAVRVFRAKQRLKKILESQNPD